MTERLAGGSSLQVLPCAAALVDAGLRITDANDAFVHYLRRVSGEHTKVRGAALTSLCPETQRAWFRRELRLRRKVECPPPLTLTTPRTTLELTPVPRKDDEGWLVLLRRVRQLSASSVAGGIEGQQIGALAHDLKMPLQAVLGWVSLLRKKPVDGERLEEVLQIVERNARMVIDLIQELLETARHPGTEVAMRCEDLDLTALVRSVVDDLRPLAEGEGVGIRGPIGTRAVVVRGDLQRLTRVVSNLVVNAIKFSPPGTAVECGVSSDGDSAHITVRDHGQGISAGFLPYVFDPFRREQPRGGRVEGVGLGLAVVRDLVHRHGGRVRAESEGRGRGSVFTVILPHHRVAHLARPVVHEARKRG